MGEIHKKGIAPISVVMQWFLDCGDLVCMYNTGATDEKGGKQTDLFLDVPNCCKFQETQSFVASMLKNSCCDETASVP